MSGGIFSGSSSEINVYARVSVTTVPTITKASSNVSSITDRGVGTFTVNHSALPSENGSVVATCSDAYSIGRQDTNVLAQTTTATPLVIARVSDGAARDDSFSIIMVGS